MSLPNALASALRRLDAALDHLEAAAERRGLADAARGNIEEELAIMQDDRTRLAVELDGALAQGKTLNLAHDEVARRLERARLTIENVIGGLAEDAGPVE